MTDDSPRGTDGRQNLAGAIIIRRPDSSGLAQAAASISQRASAITIKSAEDYQDVGDFLTYIAQCRAQVKALFEDAIKSAHAAHKTVINARDSLDRPLADAETTVKDRMLFWEREQECIRREREARLREEALRQEEERKKQEIEELRASGHELAAQQVEAMPVAPPPVVVPSAVPVVKGVSTRKGWDWRIVNANLIPREYWSVDEKKIRAVVKQLGPDCKIPGIEVFEVSTKAVRRA